MKKFTFILAILIGMFASVDAQKTLKFEDYDFCYGGLFNKVSNNGKYVVGYTDASMGGSHTAFVYFVEEDSVACLNPEYEKNPEFSHLVAASAMDASDNGIIVGRYAFTDTYSRPAFYNIATNTWTELELPANIKGKLTADASQYGEATSISADGKYIGGYVIGKMDNSTIATIVPRNVPCVWVRTNDDETNPEYKLQMPIDDDHTKISCNGDWAWHMSDDAKCLGGNSSAKSGCFNVAIWENNFNDSILDRQIIIGKDDWDRSEDDNNDGNIDDEDGADAGQYWWGATVSCISPNGEWICGYHSFNGTGYASSELTPVGFRYNTITKELQDTLPFGRPTVIFDDGSMIYDNTNIMSSSDDKEVQCGTYVMSWEMGQTSMPFILFPNLPSANEMVNENLNVNIYANNSTLYVDGEFTSIEIYSVLGALIGEYNNQNSEINVSNLNKGVYLIRIIDGNKFSTKKISL